MSIVAEEQLLSPPDLLECEYWVGGQSQGAWWLLHTRSRQEKVVARDLMNQGCSIYLPLVIRRSLSRGRPRLAEIPLFPGYVFLFGDGEARLSALKTNKLAAVHQVSDGEVLRRDLLAISTLIATGAPLTPEDRLAIGQRVRVKSGPCAGLEGVLVKRHGRGRLVIWISQLLQGASVELDDCALEAI